MRLLVLLMFFHLQTSGCSLPTPLVSGYNNDKLQDTGKMVVKRLNEIKKEQLTVVSRRGGGGGGGAHGGGGHGSSGHGGSAGHSGGRSNEHGQTRSPFTNVVPLYAAGGAAAANNRHHRGGTSGGALNCKAFGHLAYVVMAVIILVCMI